MKENSNLSKNKVTIDSNQETKLNELNKKKASIVDFIKQKKKFILENSFDIKGTTEFLASKEVAMRVIKLNDEIIEDVIKNDEDYDVKDIYQTNLGNKTNKNKVNKKFSSVQIKNKFKSNKEIISDVNFKNLKKELKRINEKIKSKESNANINDVNSKSKGKKKKNKKIKKDSFENQIEVGSRSPHKKFNGNLTSLKKESSIGFPLHKQTQSQFLFSEINKKLMADDEINLSEIEHRNMSPKERVKNKSKAELYFSQINNTKIFNEQTKNKINENVIIEEDKNKYPENINLGIQINSDKESLISILSDLM